MYQFVPIDSYSVMGHHWKEPSVHLSFRHLCTWIRSLPESSAGWIVPPFSVFPHGRYLSPLITFLALYLASLVLRRRGRITSLILLAMLCLMQPEYHWPFLQPGHIADTHSTWCPPGPPGHTKLLSSQITPSIYWCLGLFISMDEVCIHKVNK